MTAVQVTWRLWAGLARFADAMVFIVMLEAALKTRRKVLRFASTHSGPPDMA
jgi:hypothetical protein